MATSPLAKLGAVFDTMTPGLAQWQDCFLAMPGLTLMGGVRVIDGQLELGYVMKGVDLAGVEGCAKKASFPAVVDDDERFISIELPTVMGPMKAGYLVLPDGALLTHQAMPIGGAQVLSATTRAALEQDVASLESGTARDDTALVAALADVDRGKAIYFVGTGAGTPLADKLGAIHGTLDLGSGLDIDVTIQLTDPALADNIAETIPKAKARAYKLGPEIAAIADKLEFEHKGDTLHLAIAIDNTQMTMLLDKLSPMIRRGH